MIENELLSSRRVQNVVASYEQLLNFQEEDKTTYCFGDHGEHYFKDGIDMTTKLERVEKAIDAMGLTIQEIEANPDFTYRGMIMKHMWEHNGVPLPPYIQSLLERTGEERGAARAASTAPRLFVDLDGTLAVFNPMDTLETLYQPGYFRNLAPNEKVVEAIQLIIDERPDIEVHILSAVLTDSKYALEEKNAWLDEHLQEIDQAHRIFPPCGTDKKDFIPYGVRPSDFLLDDYSKNLHLWEPPAKGIKLINGINGTHGTWQGHQIDYQMEPRELANAILDHINALTAEQAVEAVKPPVPEPMTTKVREQPQARHRGGDGQVVQAIKEHFDLMSHAQSRYGMQFETKASKGWYRCLEPDSLYINPIEQRFVRHSRHVGGDIIDFVEHFEKCTKAEALSMLRKEMSGQPPMRKDGYDAFRVSKVKPFELPEKLDGRYKRLFGYLISERGINPDVVKDMVKRNLLYESAKHHNCVFVGYDYDGVPRSASMRSTGSVKFSGEVEGGNKLGWVVNPGHSTVFIGEAPIDIMSMMSMLQSGGKNYNDFTFIATGGNPKHGVVAEHMKNNPYALRVFLCHDNDEAGHILAATAKDEILASGFAGKIERKVPTYGKDFNEELKSIVFAKQPEQDTTKTIQQEVTPCLSQE